MIRKHNPEDLEQILAIWYKSSTLAHPFLEMSYVEKVKGDMRNLYVPGSDTWVYIVNNTIIGFISMMGNEIAGFFVVPSQHSKGIGTQLIDMVAKLHNELEVEVFEKNEIGRSFYSKYGFKLLKQFFHEESGNEVMRLAYKCK